MTKGQVITCTVEENKGAGNQSTSHKTTQIVWQHLVSVHLSTSIIQVLLSYEYKSEQGGHRSVKTK